MQLSLTSVPRSQNRHGRRNQALSNIETHMCIVEGQPGQWRSDPGLTLKKKTSCWNQPTLSDQPFLGGCRCGDISALFLFCISAYDFLPEKYQRINSLFLDMFDEPMVAGCVFPWVFLDPGWIRYLLNP